MSPKSMLLRRKRSRNKKESKQRETLAYAGPKRHPSLGAEAAVAEGNITTAETENNEENDSDPYDFGSESDFKYPF